MFYFIKNNFKKYLIAISIFCVSINVFAKNVSDKAIFLAVKNKNIEKIRSLISDGLEVDTLNEEGESPLFLATENGHLQIVQFFLDKGANVNLKSKAGNTALFIATEEGNLKIARLLCKRGASSNIVNNIGETALFTAVEVKNFNLVKFFVTEKNSNVNLKSKAGNTPLHIAAEESMDIHGELKKIIKLLIKSSADITIKNSSGETPFTTAKDLKVKKLLQ